MVFTRIFRIFVYPNESSLPRIFPFRLRQKMVYDLMVVDSMLHLTNQNMTAFDRAEYNNRPAAVKVLKKLCAYDPRFEGGELKETRVEDKTRYDFGLEKDADKILVEHKARNYEKRDFKDGQLNGRKYDTLRSLIKDDVKGVFYINTFLDGCAIGNLKKDIGERRWSIHTLNTVVNSDLVTEYDMFFKLEDALYIE